MIDVQDLSFSYGRTPILKGITLALKPGRFYAIVGPNGCGKTTLIKLLSRLNPPSSGTIVLDGMDYRNFTRKAFAQQIALLPQGRNTPNTSVFDLVCCGRYPYLGLSRNLTEADHEAVAAALSITDTARFSQKNLKKLSGGERQRVYMAMLYAQDTPYVLLDEPTTYLDLENTFQITKLLCQMRDQGKCVVAVLHDLSIALKYADEIIVMEAGQVRSVAGPQETVNSGILESIFGVRCRKVDIEGHIEYLFEPLTVKTTS